MSRQSAGWREARPRSLRILAAIAVTVILVLPPRAAAQAPAPGNERHQSVAEKLAQSLSTLDARLAAWDEGTAAKAQPQSLRRDLVELDRLAMEDFARIERRLVARRLPQVIRDRHARAVAEYRARMDTLLARLRGAEAAETPDAARKILRQTRELLASQQKKRTRRPFDPTDMPDRAVAESSRAEPKTEKLQFATPDPAVETAARKTAAKAFEVGGLPGADDPALLAETDEVRLSPAILAKAAELGHDPIRIFDWVRNNVQWVPTWGAKQSADVTLGSLKGNAFDTTSLLISLLRASGIPARYVHGTIEVPSDRFLAWVSGFDSIDAAWDFVGDGGVPITGVTSGGRVTKLRLEHVWVEAALDFVPSKGAVNRSADTWVPMDASFKQQQRLSAPDYLAASGVDPVGAFDDYFASGSSNDAEGWVQGLDDTVLAAGFALSPATATALTASARNLVNTQYDPDDHGSFSQVFGAERTVEEDRPSLSLSLPYRPLVVGARYAAVPPSLQAQAVFSFGVDIFGDFLDPVTLPFARVNNERLTISFTVATLADHDTLAAFLPDPSTVTGLDDLPGSLPAYLIQVRPELRLDGEVVASGTPLAIGEEVRFAFKTVLPGVGQTKRYTVDLPAGSHLAVGVMADSVDPRRFGSLEQRFGEAAAVLDTGTLDDVLAYAPNLVNRLGGDIFYGGMLEFFGKQVAVGELLGTGSGTGRAEILSGVGTFGYRPETRFFFGLPRAIELGGVVMDVPHLLYAVEARDGDPRARRLLALQLGLYGSSLEADVPAGLFTFDPAAPAEGASAANNLRRAMREGQRVYAIDSGNRGALAQIHFDPDAMAEITAAVDAGFEVVTHTDLLPLGGTTGGQTTSGYVITDPVTGFGLYRLGTGANGGRSDVADRLMQDCAYTNRPGFINPDNDWARQLLARKCADVARTLKQKAAEARAKAFEAAFKSVKNFHEVYAKVPMVLVDCMMAGAPELLADALILVRTAAAQLAIQAAFTKLTLPIADFLKKASEKLLEFVKKVHSICLGESP